MDVIVVPESTSSEPTHGASGAGSPMSHWLALLILGFIMLASSAGLGMLVADSELLALLSALGYLVATTGALMGVFRSKASVKKRVLWFGVTQVLAALVWVASTSH